MTTPLLCPTLLCGGGHGSCMAQRTRVRAVEKTFGSSSGGSKGWHALGDLRSHLQESMCLVCENPVSLTRCLPVDELRTQVGFQQLRYTASCP